MKRTKLLWELRAMKFEESYNNYKAGRLTQEEAAPRSYSWVKNKLQASG